MGRAITRADFESVFKTFAEIAVPAFNENGHEHPPMLFFVALGEKPGEIEGFDTVPAKLTSSFFEDERGKNALSTFLRMMTTPGTIGRKMFHEQKLHLPDIIVQINEAWVLNMKFKGKPLEEVRAEERARSANKESLEHRPGRTEAIVIMLHTNGFSTLGQCPILDNPRRAEMGELAHEGWQGEGRFCMTRQEP